MTPLETIKAKRSNILTASRMSTMMMCLRRHYWQYEVGLRHDTEATALRFGSAWHRAVEARWLGADFDGALAAAVPANTTYLDELGVATIAGLLAGYFARYHGEQFIEKVYPEVPFSGVLVGSRTFSVAAILDGLVILRDGRLALKEDKTTGDSIAPDSDYWIRLAFNPQLMQYVLAARALGWDVATIIYDVVRKPAIAPKQIPLLCDSGKKIVLDADRNRVFKANGDPRESGDTAKGYTLQSAVETPAQFGQRLLEDTKERPDFYFVRKEVPILEDQLEEFAEHRLTIARLALHCRNSEGRFGVSPERAWPRNVSESTCRSCSFSGFCLQNTKVDIAHPPAGFKICDPHPELARRNAVD